ncbi:PAS domain S-box protein [Flavobacterium eburneipallidum]|uniref:PAS domain S-box protein n=1 Tax=Flavobacterium eburneipallidum TaxID=3003263 RepID=UPI002482EF62|nr:PAS domain S-box protein [Flavobacterium eburneipallidum]
MKENASKIPSKFAQEIDNKYKTIFDSNRDSITIFRLNDDNTPGNFIDVNPATIALLGYSRKELLTMSVRDIENLSDEERKKRIEDLLANGKIIFTTKIKNKAGKNREVEVETFLINHENQPAFMNITRDITERKQMEISYKKAHQNLVTLIDAIPDLLFEIGLDGKIHHYHSGRNDLLAVPEEEFINKFFYDILPPDVSAICQKAISEANQKGWSGGAQYSLDLPNGKSWFEISVSRINEDADKETHFILLARDITQRKEAEKVQSDALDLLQNITSRVPGIVYQYKLHPDGSSCFPYASDGMKQIYGVEPKDVKKDASIITDIIHPDDFSQIMDSILESAKNLTQWNQEYRVILKNKTVRNVFGTATPQLEEDGSVLWHGFITDITDKKVIEESLRESEEKYRGLIENSPDTVVIYRDGIIVFTNDEGIRMVGGKSKDDIIGKPVLDFIHPDSIDSVLQRMEEVTRDEKASKIIEEKFIDLNGKPIFVEIKAIPTVFEKKPAVQVIIHDITQTKQNQEKIKQLSQAVEQSPVTIIITNTYGEIEYVNPKFTATTGYSFEEIIGKNPRILKSNHTSPDDYEQLWKTISSGNAWHGEFHNVRKNGELYWESSSISPILNVEGKTTHYIAINEDITERKKVEKQLINAKEKAEESDRLKLAFLANMSHEIRTPMNGILGFTELLKAPNLAGKEQQEYITIIEKSGVRMLNIINDIISISKVESGQIEVSLSETNINEQIDYLYHFFKPEATQKGIKLYTNTLLETKEAILLTDKEKLYAILTNLVKNAIKFTDSGTIEFGYRKKEKFLEFYVKDSGLGISSSQQKIIFERFRQANDTISRSHEGSGLGLAISKAYVEKLGGKIWVTSEEGKGSTFYFTIPFDAISKTKEIPFYETVTTEVKTTSITKNLKVLVVEDDAISQLLIAIALKPFAKEILKISTGIEAIEICKNNTDIDLVMMDINMPEMSGHDATKAIREFNKDLIIIAQTANGMQSDRDDAIAAGCTDYISKPVNITILNELIEKYFI